jgi:hypothetical protein
MPVHIFVAALTGPGCIQNSTEPLLTQARGHRGSYCSYKET